MNMNLPLFCFSFLSTEDLRLTMIQIDYIQDGLRKDSRSVVRTASCLSRMIRYGTNNFEIFFPPRMSIFEHCLFLFQRISSRPIGSIMAPDSEQPSKVIRNWTQAGSMGERPSETAVRMANSKLDLQQHWPVHEWHELRSERARWEMTITGRLSGMSRRGFLTSSVFDRYIGLFVIRLYDNMEIRPKYSWRSPSKCSTNESTRNNFKWFI